MAHHPQHHSTRSLQVCMKVVGVSVPFNAGQEVEIKFELAPCHGITGGELRIRVPPEAAKFYLLGDEKSIRINSI